VVYLVGGELDRVDEIRLAGSSRSEKYKQPAALGASRPTTTASVPPTPKELGKPYDLEVTINGVERHCEVKGSSS
jgi:hypothetical protein